MTNNFFAQMIPTLVAGLISIIGLVATFKHERRQQRRNQKFKVLVDFMANSFDLNSPDYQRAMNSIRIIYHDSEEVQKAWINFTKYINSPDIQERTVLDMISTTDYDQSKAKRQSKIDSHIKDIVNAMLADLQLGENLKVDEILKPYSNIPIENDNFVLPMIVDFKFTPGTDMNRVHEVMDTLLSEESFLFQIMPHEQNHAFYIVPKAIDLDQNSRMMLIDTVIYRVRDNLGNDVKEVHKILPPPEN